MFRLLEVGVATQDDQFVPGLQAQPDRFIDLLGGPFVRRPVARAIDQTQNFAGLGQAEHQWMVAPGAVVGDVHARLARASGLGEGAVHVDGGTLEEALRLLGPDLEPHLVDGFVQVGDAAGTEAAAEIACGGGIGNALRPQGVEEGLVVAAQLDVFQAGAVAQSVVGNVQDVVRFVIRLMNQEHMQTPVDGLGQAELLHEQVKHADAATGNAVVAKRHVIVDVACREGGPFARALMFLVKPALNSRLEMPVPRAEDRFHSKSFHGRGELGSDYFHKPHKPRRISSFFTNSEKRRARRSLVQGLGQRRTSG